MPRETRTPGFWMDCFQHAPRGNRDICALTHTHETCMETPKQSYITKTNKKKDEGTKLTKCPRWRGELTSAGGELQHREAVLRYCTQQVSPQPAGLLPTHQGWEICLTSSLQGILSFLYSSLSAGLDSRFLVTRHGMPGPLLMICKTSSQITALSY